MYVDDIKLAGKKQHLYPMWKLLNKEVDLGEPTSFLDHVYLGYTQRHCQISKDIVDLVVLSVHFLRVSVCFQVASRRTCALTPTVIMRVIDLWLKTHWKSAQNTSHLS